MEDFNATVQIYSVGVIRRIDQLGRICLPAEYRRALGIETDTPVEMVLTDKGILLCTLNTGDVPGILVCQHLKTE